MLVVQLWSCMKEDPSITATTLTGLHFVTTTLMTIVLRWLGYIQLSHLPVADLMLFVLFANFFNVGMSVSLMWNFVGFYQGKHTAATALNSKWDFAFLRFQFRAKFEGNLQYGCSDYCNRELKREITDVSHFVCAIFTISIIVSNKLNFDIEGFNFDLEADRGNISVCLTYIGTSELTSEQITLTNHFQMTVLIVVIDCNITKLILLSSKMMTWHTAICDDVLEEFYLGISRSNDSRMTWGLISNQLALEIIEAPAGHTYVMCLKCVDSKVQVWNKEERSHGYETDKVYYKEFRDVISFDATFRTNNEQRIQGIARSAMIDVGVGFRKQAQRYVLEMYDAGQVFLLDARVFDAVGCDD
ncbi:hypothetical protein L2E82_40648 [Cichorium intybus]|uniref:Uncharacterized protein n=1 Tax=Cichorium intybus TaxID=13427 RepID=A0ACB9ALD6_CICIN|nr:hypothetical protein L2E82_40648 [Cichorium intybus]